MSGKQKESMSALMDGEASEIEIHRMLRDPDMTEELKQSFFTFQYIRQVIRSPSGGRVALDVERHGALFERISAAVADEEGYDMATPNERRWMKPVAGFAVAASLLVAIGVGVNLNPGSDSGVVAGQPHPGQPANSTSVAIATQPVSTVVARPGVENGLTPELTSELVAELPDLSRLPELKELDQENLKLLREYLNRHDRARLGSDQQLVTYPKPGR